MTEMHEDQKKVINALRQPWEFWESDDNVGIRGVTVEQLCTGIGISSEKILLSLGWLEEQQIVAHDMGIERKVIDYFGHTNLVVPGSQKGVRLFYLTSKGKELAKTLEEA